MSKPKIIPLTDEIFCIYRASYFNCTYLIHRNQRTTLIDTGMSSDGFDVFYTLEKLGIGLESVDKILITHWHNDHTAGTKAVKDATDAKVYCHAADRPFMEHDGIEDSFATRFADLIPERGLFILFKGLIGERVPVAVGVDELVEDGMLIDDTFEVIVSPGHTEGHVAYFDRVSGTLFAGDALACIQGKIRFMARPVTPDLAASRVSMKKLLSRDIRYLCPGHRQPLVENVEAERKRMLTHLEEDGKWPFWG